MYIHTHICVPVKTNKNLFKTKPTKKIPPPQKKYLTKKYPKNHHHRKVPVDEVLLNQINQINLDANKGHRVC